jgi:hypothetical protein
MVIPSSPNTGFHTHVSPAIRKYLPAGRQGRPSNGVYPFQLILSGPKFLLEKTHHALWQKED